MFSVEATAQNARKILRIALKHNLTVDPKLYDLLIPEPVPVSIPGFAFKLKDFQAEGVAWLESHLGTGLLADEQGLGKTIQVLAYAHRNKKFPMLIVCPNTLKLNWRNEIIATTGQQYKINLIGKDLSQRLTAARKITHPTVTYSKTPQPNHDIYIINYEALARNLNDLIALDFKLMALDESHKVKNHDAARTKAFIQLATGEVEHAGKLVKKYKVKVTKPIPCVIMMSGTPLLNRPAELYTTVYNIARYVPEFSGFVKFHFRFCNPINTGYGMNFNGCSNSDELHKLLQEHVMIRRIKKDVLKELPEKNWQTIPLEFDRKEYDKVESAFLGQNWTQGIETILKFGGNPPKSDDSIVAIQKLREIAAYSKLDSAVEWIKDFIETGEKLVVFAHHRMVIEKIQNELIKNGEHKNAVRVIYGNVSAEDRQKAVNEFQTLDSVRVIIIGITAGGYGLTLTAANNVAFVQLPWTPGEIQQCADRVHRIGQKNTVTCYNLVAEGTIEETIATMLMNKGMVLDAVLDDNRQVNTVSL